jgi:DNA-binding beta-propeller fold protein YncE
MKLTSSIAATLLWLLASASASMAATNPLSYPTGLALDSKGNLWVANTRDNNILVFAPSYALEKSKTITQGINGPTGTAFDPMGNLWVSNNTNFTVTEYTEGVQNTSATISSGIIAPEGLVIDGLGDIWVNDNNTTVTVYGPPSPFAPPTSLIRTLQFPTFVYGMEIGGGTLSFGGAEAVFFVAADSALISGTLYVGVNAPNNTGAALASDALGNVYMANYDGSVNIYVPVPGNPVVVPFVTLSFAPTGIAVDFARQRVYISNGNGNSISVYNTAGALLKVIE